MKKIAIVLISLCLIFPNSTWASHGMGGEISWECLGSGAYKFRLVFYRDCNGIAAPLTVNLNTTVPGIPTVQLLRISQIDISYNGFQASGAPCLNCNSGFPTPQPGMVEKNVYESASVFLSGVPPAQGWSFSWGECCRNMVLTNINDPASIGFQYKATMYPYNGLNAGSCYDSSPVFAEEPMRSFCSGVPQQYSYFAYDFNGDSLSYQWDTATDEYGTPLSYNPGYSGTVPFPGPSVINPFTGMVTYSGITGGYFNTKVKITAYRCGIKISENYREIDVAINNNCPPLNLAGGGTSLNYSPVMAAPFSVNTSYIDTVIAGELIESNLTWTDFQFYLMGNGQQIKIEHAGGTFGTNFMPGTSNCENAPCPSVIPSLPYDGTIAVLLKFAWQTTSDHYNYTGQACSNPVNEYDLFFKACDNYCPANACVTNGIKIVLLPDSIVLKAPSLRCAQISGDDVILNWIPTTSNDSLGLFESYLIYAKPAGNSAWILIDSLQGNINASTYTHTGQSISNAFGISANTNLIQYRIVTRSGYFGGEESIPSNIISTTIPALTVLSSNYIRIEFANPSYPSAIPSHSIYYKIYREYPSGNWTLLDSTTNLNYVDSSAISICNDSIFYRVELEDMSGCTNISSRKGVFHNNITGPAITNSNLNICFGGSLILNAINAQSYLWSTGQTTQQITVTTPGNYFLTVTLFGGCVRQDTINVTSSGPVSVNITGTTAFCQGSNSALNAGGGYANYQWNTGAATQIINVSNGGLYFVTVTDINGCTATDSVLITVNPLPYFQVTGDSVICAGQIAVLNAGGTFASYLWSTGATTQIINISTPGIYSATVTNNNGCIYSDNIQVIPAPPYNTILTASGPTAFCSGDSVMLSSLPGMSSYLWFRNNFLLPGITQQEVWLKNPGNYKCETIDSSGCNGVSNSVRLSIICFPPPPPINKEAVTDINLVKIHLYPNPSGNDFIISIENGIADENVKIKILDLLGRETHANWNVQSENSIVVQNLPTGTYFIRLQIGGASHIEKIVKL